MTTSALTDVLQTKVPPPVAIALGTHHEVTELLTFLDAHKTICYQMDLYQAGRLSEDLHRQNQLARVVTAPDLWDLPPDFQTVLYPAPQGGERSLKIDMVEQAFHVLRTHGSLVVVSPYDKDRLFPALLKKVFGRVRATVVGKNIVFWSRRERDRRRRRHEITFQVRIGAGPSLRFLSRPGVFSYGRFDEGARALVETMHIEGGDRVLDMGCGCGTNGIFAAERGGPTSAITFVDSNVRATALAELNARANGLIHFQTVASNDLAELREESFDVVLANPPYYAQNSIARLFVERSRKLLKPGGRLYLVTKQMEQIEILVAEHFNRFDAMERRGYVVVCSKA